MRGGLRFDRLPLVVGRPLAARADTRALPNLGLGSRGVVGQADGQAEAEVGAVKRLPTRLQAFRAGFDIGFELGFKEGFKRGRKSRKVKP